VSSRVSVVMPAYNARDTIGAAISGVLSQTTPPLELLIVDDGSTDVTVSLAKSFGAPIRVIEQGQHLGVAAARAVGIRDAVGDLIAFCDADDYWFDEHLAECIKVRDQTGMSVTSNSYWLYPRGVESGRLRYRGRFPAAEEQRMAILKSNFVSTMCLFPRLKAIEVGSFDPDILFASDWDFWIRMIYSGERVALSRAPLSLWRWGLGMSAQRETMDRYSLRALEKAALLPDLTEAECAYIEIRLTDPGPRELVRSGAAALRSGSYRNAARDLQRAARLNPLERPLVWKSRLLSLSPRLVGPALRRREIVRDRRLGLDSRHVR
jgi:glycosyltransferase involved in cell wall biosynthesis